jgi:catechol 2,3-dioxygenase-like lactoylglutathione lyase family enzyme
MALDTMRGLSHVFLSVADVDRSIAFYTDVFGWEPLFDETLDGPEFEAVVGVDAARCRSVGGRVGDLRLEFVDNNWTPKTPPANGLGLRGLSFEVSDAQAAWEACEAMGVTTEGPPHETFGCVIFFLRDPDGQRLEMVQYLEGTKAWGGEGGRPELGAR